MKEAYVVACHSCRGSFDAMGSVWCSCLATERTLVCPRCLECFCKAPPSYKSGFWSQAPRSLWDHKFEEHRRREDELAQNPAPEALPRPLVLVVDDEQSIRRAAARVVESLGFGVVLGRNGEEGLELVRRYKPDLVLSDALMPRMDGREMCRRIKQDPAIADTPVVVMTALYRNVKYHIEAARVFRVDGYVDKPLDVRALRSMLEKHLAAPALAVNGR